MSKVFGCPELWSSPTFLTGRIVGTTIVSVTRNGNAVSGRQNRVRVKAYRHVPIDVHRYLPLWASLHCRVIPTAWQKMGRALLLPRPALKARLLHCVRGAKPALRHSKGQIKSRRLIAAPDPRTGILPTEDGPPKGS